MKYNISNKTHKQVMIAVDPWKAWKHTFDQLGTMGYPLKVAISNQKFENFTCPQKSTRNGERCN